MPVVAEQDHARRRNLEGGVGQVPETPDRQPLEPHYWTVMRRIAVSPRLPSRSVPKTRTVMVAPAWPPTVSGSPNRTESPPPMNGLEAGNPALGLEVDRVDAIRVDGAAVDDEHGSRRGHGGIGRRAIDGRHRARARWAAGVREGGPLAGIAGRQQPAHPEGRRPADTVRPGPDARKSWGEN